MAPQVEVTHRSGRQYLVSGLSPQPADQLRFKLEDGTDTTVAVRACTCTAGILAPPLLPRAWP
jgi:hypothetical protein